MIVLDQSRLYRSSWSGVLCLFTRKAILFWFKKITGQIHDMLEHTQKVLAFYDKCLLRSNVPKLGIFNRGEPINCSTVYIEIQDQVEIWRPHFWPYFLNYTFSKKYSTRYLKRMGMIANILILLSQVVFWRKKYQFLTDLNSAQNTWGVFKAFPWSCKFKPIKNLYFFSKNDSWEYYQDVGYHTHSFQVSCRMHSWRNIF